MHELDTFRPVIGLEIHIQLKTASKMFCASANNPDETVPNTNICEVCTGQPGTLPVINEEAVRLTIMAGLALHCQIPEYSKFDRKHYFYPDLPKGYQISQYDKPLATAGYLDIEVPLENGETKTKRIRITRAHLEEDAGKNIHPEGLGYSLVDYNRAGTPLLEIVTEPDIESAQEAKIFLQELRNIVRYVGVSSADMEKGTMRCEPSISVRKPGEEGLPPYKVEIKNINSFSFAESAIEYEILRQTAELTEGKIPKQVTMGWNEKAKATVLQRTKEQANDYRYFPEPDLPILHISKERLDEIAAAIPELPAAKRLRFAQEYGLPIKDIQSLIDWKDLNYYFEQVVSELTEWFQIKKIEDKEITKFIKLASNWCLQDFSALLKTHKLDPNAAKITPQSFAELITLIEEGTISSTAAKQVFQVLFEKGGEPLNIIADLGLNQVSDTGLIDQAIDRVIANNPKAVEDYKAGQMKSFGFLVGMAMKELQGKGNPQVVNENLKKKLV